MQQEEVLKVIEKHLIRSVSGMAEGTIDPVKKLTDYGANSLDVVEIVSGAMREMKVRIPRPELGDIQNIQGLVDKFIEHAK
jgi:acyl carrier protein